MGLVVRDVLRGLCDPCGPLHHVYRLCSATRLDSVKRCNSAIGALFFVELLSVTAHLSVNMSSPLRIWMLMWVDFVSTSALVYVWRVRSERVGLVTTTGVSQ